MSEPKYEADVRGRHERSEASDPKHFVLLGPDYRGEPQIMCDTLNCHHMFSLEEQADYMVKIADVLNRVEAMRQAIADLCSEKIYENGKMADGISVRFLARMTNIKIAAGMAPTDDAFARDAARELATPTT